MILFSPHADDETLFAAFLVIRHRPDVVICFPSSGDYGDTATRTEESRRAVAMLGGGLVVQWGGEHLEEHMRAIDEARKPERVFAPSAMASHPDHVAVAIAAGLVFGDRVTAFHTYDARAGGKVRAGNISAYRVEWVERKRLALACYQSQLAHPRAREFFSWDLTEYLA